MRQKRRGEWGNNTENNATGRVKMRKEDGRAGIYEDSKLASEEYLYVIIWVKLRKLTYPFWLPGWPYYNLISVYCDHLCLNKHIMAMTKYVSQHCCPHYLHSVFFYHSINMVVFYHSHLKEINLLLPGTPMADMKNQLSWRAQIQTSQRTRVKW